MIFLLFLVSTQSDFVIYSCRNVATDAISVLFLDLCVVYSLLFSNYKPIFFELVDLSIQVLNFCISISPISSNPNKFDFSVDFIHYFFSQVNYFYTCLLNLSLLGTEMKIYEKNLQGNFYLILLALLNGSFQVTQLQSNFFTFNIIRFIHKDQSVRDINILLTQKRNQFDDFQQFLVTQKSNQNIFISFIAIQKTLMDGQQTQNIGNQLAQDLLKNQIAPFKAIPKAHNNSIQAVAAHPSHQNFATGSHDKTIKLWDVGKFTQLATYTDHKEGVWSLDYSNDGKMLVSASPDKQVLIWDTKKSTAGQKLVGHKDKVYCAKISEDDKLIASIGEGSQLLIWDIAKAKQPIKRLDLNTFVSYDISWSNNGQYLFVTSIGGKTTAIDSKTLNIVDQAVLNVDAHKKMEGVCANWKTLPGKIFGACESGLIVWYSFKQGKLVKQIEFVAHVGAGCRNVNLHPTQKYMLSSGKDGSVRLWNCNEEGKPKIQANLVYHEQNVTCPVFVGEQIVVTGSWDQGIGLWKYKDLMSIK